MQWRRCTNSMRRSSGSDPLAWNVSMYIGGPASSQEKGVRCCPKATFSRCRRGANNDGPCLFMIAGVSPNTLLPCLGHWLTMWVWQRSVKSYQSMTEGGHISPNLDSKRAQPLLQIPSRGRSWRGFSGPAES